jgi:hypothetical protein
MTGFAVFVFAVTFAGGYAASVYTWDKVKVFINGAEAEIRALDDKAKVLRDKIKAVL